MNNIFAISMLVTIVCTASLRGTLADLERSKRLADAAEAVAAACVLDERCAAKFVVPVGSDPSALAHDVGDLLESHGIVGDGLGLIEEGMDSRPDLVLGLISHLRDSCVGPDELSESRSTAANVLVATAVVVLSILSFAAFFAVSTSKI